MDRMGGQMDINNKSSFEFCACPCVQLDVAKRSCVMRAE